MAGKREKPDYIVMKLRQVAVLQGQGMSVAEAVRLVGMTKQTYYRSRRQHRGMSRDQLKELEKENARLCRAVTDLTLDKLIRTGRPYSRKITISRIKSSVLLVMVKRRSWLLPGTAISTSCRCLEMSTPTRTQASEVRSTLALAGLLYGVVRKTTIET